MTSRFQLLLVLILTLVINTDSERADQRTQLRHQPLSSNKEVGSRMASTHEGRLRGRPIHKTAWSMEANSPEQSEENETSNIESKPQEPTSSSSVVSRFLKYVKSLLSKTSEDGQSEEQKVGPSQPGVKLAKKDEVPAIDEEVSNSVLRYMKKVLAEASISDENDRGGGKKMKEKLTRMPDPKKQKTSTNGKHFMQKKKTQTTRTLVDDTVSDSSDSSSSSEDAESERRSSVPAHRKFDDGSSENVPRQSAEKNTKINHAPNYNNNRVSRPIQRTFKKPFQPPNSKTTNFKRNPSAFGRNRNFAKTSNFVKTSSNSSDSSEKKPPTIRSSAGVRAKVRNGNKARNSVEYRNNRKFYRGKNWNRRQDTSTLKRKPNNYSQTLKFKQLNMRTNYPNQVKMLHEDSSSSEELSGEDEESGGTRDTSSSDRKSQEKIRKTDLVNLRNKIRSSQPVLLRTKTTKNAKYLAKTPQQIQERNSPIKTVQNYRDNQHYEVRINTEPKPDASEKMSDDSIEEHSEESEKHPKNEFNDKEKGENNESKSNKEHNFPEKKSKLSASKPETTDQRVTKKHMTSVSTDKVETDRSESDKVVYTPQKSKISVMPKQIMANKQDEKATSEYADIDVDSTNDQEPITHLEVKTNNNQAESLIKQLSFKPFSEYKSENSQELLITKDAQKTPVRTQKTSVDAQKTSVSAQKTSIGDQKTAVAAQKTAVGAAAQLTAFGAQKTTVDAHKTALQEKIPRLTSVNHIPAKHTTTKVIADEHEEPSQATADRNLKENALQISNLSNKLTDEESENDMKNKENLSQRRNKVHEHISTNNINKIQEKNKVGLENTKNPQNESDDKMDEKLQNIHPEAHQAKPDFTQAMVSRVSPAASVPKENIEKIIEKRKQEFLQHFEEKTKNENHQVFSVEEDSKEKESTELLNTDKQNVNNNNNNKDALFNKTKHSSTKILLKTDRSTNKLKLSADTDTKLKEIASSQLPISEESRPIAQINFNENAVRVGYHKPKEMLTEKKPSKLQSVNQKVASEIHLDNTIIKIGTSSSNDKQLNFHKQVHKSKSLNLHADKEEALKLSEETKVNILSSDLIPNLKNKSTGTRDMFEGQDVKLQGIGVKADEHQTSQEDSKHETSVSVHSMDNFNKGISNSEVATKVDAVTEIRSPQDQTNIQNSQSTVKVRDIRRDITRTNIEDKNEKSASMKMQEKADVNVRDQQTNEDIHMERKVVQENYSKEYVDGKRSGTFQSYASTVQDKKESTLKSEETFDTFVQYMYKHSSSDFFKTLRDSSRS